MKNLDCNTPIPELQDYLISRGWMDSSEEISSLEKPGEGNMNVVLRIKTNKRSFILKQSRPFVQKYQQIEAPLDRIAVEYDFYKTVSSEALQPHLPEILGYDAKNHVLLMEDLGHCDDLSSIYSSRSIDANNLKKLVNVLGLIHQNEVPEDFPENSEMRQLNHQHIFVLPFLEDNGFQLDDIQDGLQALSLSYKKDEKLKYIINEMGNLYLSKGETLLHGDYYPGSWMTEADNLYIIDPEFGFAGFAEFDLGVMVAHTIIATADERYLETIIDLYSRNADKSLVKKVAGIEIMRRLIGLAQLPLEHTIAEKQYLLQTAHEMILS